MGRNLEVKILGDTRDYERALKKAGVETERFAGLTHKLGATAGLAAAAGIGALALAGEKFAHAAIKAQEETGKLDRAFKNAGISAEKMGGFVSKAEMAQRKLGFTNSDTRESLTKFITAGDNAKEAMKDLGLASDYARFKGIGLADASMVLVRAHAGNLRALKALGIDMPKVTDAMDSLRIAHQRAKTKMEDWEKVAAKNKDSEATYANITKELTKRLGGQADEFSKSAEGGMAQFHAQMGNLEEQAGKHLLPAIAKVSGKLAEIMGIFGGAGSAGDKFAKVLESLGVNAEMAHKIVEKTAAVFGTIGTVIDAVWPTVKRAFDILIRIVQDFAQVVQGMVEIVSGLLHGDFGKVWEGLKDVVGGVLKGITDQIGGVAGIWWNALKGPLDTLFVQPFTNAWNAVAEWFNKAEGFVAKVAGYIGGLPEKAWHAYVALFETVYVKPFKAAFDAVANWLVGPDGFVTKAAGFIGSLPSKIGDFGEALKNRIIGFFEGAQIGPWISGKVTEFAAFFTGLPGQVLDFGGALLDRIKGFFDKADIGGWIKGKVDDFAGFFTKLPTKIGQAVKDGVVAGKKLLGEAIDSIFGKLSGWVKGILDINSPSKEFEQIGGFVIQGMVKGLKDGAFHLKDAILEIVKKYVIDTGFDAFKGWTQDMWDSLSNLSGDVGTFFSDLFGGGAGGVANGFAVLPELPATDHPTLGLEGYPAKDIMLPAGTVVGSPSTGSVTRTSGRPFSEGWSDGPGSAIGLSMYIAGRVADYFLTHFDRLFVGTGASIGRGTPIGTVGPMDQFGVSSHIHEGVRRLAAGGIVTKPTFALVGEAGPEAVIPLSRHRSSSGPSVIQLMLDSQVVAEAVRRQDGRWKTINAL